MNLKLFQQKQLNYFIIFCNKLQNRGLKNIAYKRVLFLLEELKLRLKQNNFFIFKQIFTMLEIYVYIYKKKIGGNIHQIPLYLKKNIRLKKGLSNLLKIINNKKGKNFIQKILQEFLDIRLSKGATITARDIMYIIAAEEKSNVRFVRPKARKIPFNYINALKI